MPTHAIALMVIQVLTALVISLIMLRFARLEKRVDNIDHLIYERSRELAALAEGQRSSNIIIMEIKQIQLDQRKELRSDIAGLGQKIEDAVKIATNLVRYSSPGPRGK
jgi:predicted phage tail protein